MRSPRRWRPPPPFIDTRRGGVHVRGDLKSSSSPRIWGAQWVTTVKSTLWGTEEHGAGRGGCPGRCPDLAEIAPVSLWFLWASWCSLLRVPSSVLTWQSIEGSAGGGLALVKARTAFEGCTHADRGFCGRGSTRSRQHNGGSSAGHVCTGRRRFPQCRHSAGDGGAVTRVGGRDFDYSCCAA